MHLKVVIEEDEEAEGYIVCCPALPGCFSQGNTTDEALENIKEAIQACLESLGEDEMKSYLTSPTSRVIDVVA
ncbi:MAG: type II toxin-antitoxin system HicB family antitoxin [Methanosarcinaceae archaeon]|nr:type II toxin-antitoxin system HicB family antitoxin [Methanosarcinaceae archaeon]